MPPISAAVNPSSRPGFTVSRDMVDLAGLTEEIAEARGDDPDRSWALVEGYCTVGQPGRAQTQAEFEAFLGGVTAAGARVVNIYGWNVPRQNPFSLGNAPGALDAIARWVAGTELPDDWRGRRPSDVPQGGPPPSIPEKARRVGETVQRRLAEGRPPTRIGEIMSRFEPLMQGGRFMEAEAVLDEPLRYLGADD